MHSLKMPPVMPDTMYEISDDLYSSWFCVRHALTHRMNTLTDAHVPRVKKNH